MSSPSSSTSPASGGNAPLIRLKNVLLPAPFGPIIAESEPDGKSKRHVVDRPHATERLGEIPDLELHRARSAATTSLRKSSTPRRRPSAKARITMPRTSP